MNNIGAVEPGKFPAVFLRDLTVAYAERPVLWDVDLDIPTGSLTAIVGPNGAGKSTLIKTILDLVPRAAGTVRVFGEVYRLNRKLVAYVPQRGSVDWDFPTDALDVVTMGLYGKLGWFKRPSKSNQELAVECLAKVGMADFAHRQISQLSGGQQQRVFLARALAQGADLYLLDEPLAGVDATTEATILELLKGLRDEGKTVIVVHHDLQTVRENFDRVALLNVRLISTGSVEESFTDDLIRSAYTPRAAESVP